jgi:hypothetical protein
VPPRQVGVIEQRIIDLLGLKVTAGTIILLGESNEVHMATEHPKAYAKYFPELENILRDPDYVTINPGDESIRYIKLLDTHVHVGVRISVSGTYFARTLFEFPDHKIAQYKARGQLKYCR